ncbi:hypothetical protein JCM10207_002789 [Rhodosporidiobolus poonsookiae]
MLYHAQSLATAGFITHIVAYRGSAPPQQLADNPHVHFVYLPTPLACISQLPRPLFLLFAPFKVVAGAWGLLKALVWTIDTPLSYLFLQNPPAIPTLPVVQLAALLLGSRVVIDWHNTGYSVLALRLGEQHPVVRLARFIEHLFGRSAYAHFCVSDAMKAQLQKEAGLKGRVHTVHDRPPSSFRRLDSAEAHELLPRLPFLSASSLSFPPSPSPPAADYPLAPSLFTAPHGPPPADRPALLVSATSWTADEDFSILLEALEMYEKAAGVYAAGKGGLPGAAGDRGGKEGKKATGKGERLPRVVVVITGKGAGKAAFEKDVEEREGRWEWVRVRTAWLAREDYPRLLGAADLGISLHTSTSGIDLPMKVVDMFGCGLPVVALDFPCLNELVQDGKNGLVFRTPSDLADRLITLLRGFPRTYPSDLDRLREGIGKVRYGAQGEGQGWGSWEENWGEVVGPVLQ